jgi:hypothetical protein
MAAGPAYIGITEESANVLIQSVEIERKLGIDVVRKSSDGGFGAAHAADPVHSFTVTILGTSDEAVGTALAMTLTSLSGGKSAVTSKTYKKTNDNFDETVLSGDHAPAATV